MDTALRTSGFADRCAPRALEVESTEASKAFAVDGGISAPSRANIITAIAARDYE